MTHWTERSVDDFVHKMSSDFILQLEKKMEEGKVSQKELADLLRVSVGRVSQFLNNPGNLTLKKIVEYSRTLGLKVAIVAYEDGDPENKNGPINSEIFYDCWVKQGRPEDFFSLNSLRTNAASFVKFVDGLNFQRLNVEEPVQTVFAVTLTSTQRTYDWSKGMPEQVALTPAFFKSDDLETEDEHA
jgi:transcriptional regulator with XRE-family HTH domain